jgi:hypothetical protein
MERIVIEVDKKLAQSWRSASAQKRRTINNKISLSLAQELYEDKAEEYQAYLDQLRKEMKEKGLTQDELDQILADG